MERWKETSLLVFPTKQWTVSPRIFRDQEGEKGRVFTYNEGAPRERRRRKKKGMQALIVSPKYAFRRDERCEYSHTCARFRWKNVGGGGMYTTWELEKFPQQYSFSHKPDPKKCHRPSRNAHYLDTSDSDSLLREDFYKLQDYNSEVLCLDLN